MNPNEHRNISVTLTPPNLDNEMIIIQPSHLLLSGIQDNQIRSSSERISLCFGIAFLVTRGSMPTPLKNLSSPDKDNHPNFP
jgi:hypothetical protein